MILRSVRPNDGVWTFEYNDNGQIAFPVTGSISLYRDGAERLTVSGNTAHLVGNAHWDTNLLAYITLDVVDGRLDTFDLKWTVIINGLPVLIEKKGTVGKGDIKVTSP